MMLHAELHADGVHRRRVLQAKVVLDQHVRVGQERIGGVIVEAQFDELGIGGQLRPRLRQLLFRGRLRAIRRLVVPEEPFERRVHQRAFHGVRGRWFGESLDHAEPEGQGAVSERAHFGRRQGAGEIERHADQDTTGV
jgi:hypothetical protein